MAAARRRLHHPGALRQEVEEQDGIQVEADGIREHHRMQGKQDASERAQHGLLLARHDDRQDGRERDDGAQAQQQHQRVQGDEVPRPQRLGNGEEKADGERRVVEAEVVMDIKRPRDGFLNALMECSPVENRHPLEIRHHQCREHDHGRRRFEKPLCATREECTKP